ncbi:peptidylprolyl isomerase [Bradyrhizobium sp. CCGUVB4N]|uniref:peptidylprolyl isomerase n=1 Tax=Bradyrhizobium sp. CCGUVB4N TaxID=2949631 RepID=UPI0020B29ECE|nr:peptidylprolyl isomerase [Bradyrhizobium sp. CCGUVB4N]MCP3384048.1 peptidylprolyl isomerase [Bradyrhizobium sp. CCGUVB4N]
MIGLPRLSPIAPIAAAGRRRTAASTTALSTIVLLGSLAIACTSSFAQTPASDPVVGVVGATELHQSDIQLAEEDMGKMLAGLDEESKRLYIATYLHDLVILSKAAKDKGLVNEADLQRRMAYTRNKALMNRMLQVTADNVTDADVRKFYDDAIRNTKPERELHICAIIFKFSNPNDEAAIAAAEAKAKSALERVAKEDFAAVARDMTDAENEKKNGGDLGWLSAAQMGKEYADVAFTLGKGGVSKPIKTEFGWHIIKIEDERTRKPNEFAAVREQVENVVRRKAQVELVDKLRAETPIAWRDDKIKPQ